MRLVIFFRMTFGLMMEIVTLIDVLRNKQTSLQKIY